MRRWVVIATFVVAVLGSSLSAQVRGVPASVTSLGPRGFASQGSFGFHGSFAFGHNRHFHGGFGAPVFRHHFRRHFFHQPISWSYPLYAPYTYDSYPAYMQSDPYYYEDDRAQRDMQRQIRDLTDAIERLRDEQENLRQEIRQRQQPAARTAAPDPPAETRPTVLVFRTKPREEVRNYAIVGQTLWIFTETRARKIPLAELDLDRTAQLNEERGLDFVLPKP
jgi:hypothetical protein